MAAMSEKLDRFARGKLSPSESRELAQQALGDHDLFDELTSTAVAKRGFAARARNQITRSPFYRLHLCAKRVAGVSTRQP